MPTPIYEANVWMLADGHITHRSEFGSAIAIRLGPLQGGFEINYQRARLSELELVKRTLVGLVNRTGCRVLPLPSSSNTTVSGSTVKVG